MRTLLRVLPLGLVAVLFSVPTSLPAQAATRSVTIFDNGFTPTPVTVAQGDSVKWTNTGVHLHTSTSKQAFWGSPTLGSGGTYTQTPAFKNAGTYGYYCTVHGLTMSGVVRVPIKASGSAGSGWTLRWSSPTSNLTNRGFDVQKKAPGTTTWVAFRTNTTARTAFFDPARNGIWKFRARTDNRSNGKSSGWSPVKSVQIS